MVSRGSVLDDPANRARLDRARRRIAHNGAALASLELHARDLYAAFDPEGAVAAAAGAARFAAGLPTGRLVSEPLERMLLELGRRAVPGGERRAAGGEHVLHVFTETYNVGGHTRLAQRWIERDAGRRHSVLVTTAVEPVPPWLADAVARAGGEVRLLARPERALDRARALRAAAEPCTAVVLHHHPYDPVPLLAFADPRGRPPVVVMNHADHVFWLGAGIADVVAEFRAQGAQVTAERRGIAPERSVLLPIPVADPPRRERARAREALGIPPERALFVTIASEYKFAPVLEPSFGALAAAALQAAPDAHLIAVGPEMDEQFRLAQEATGGRLIAVGARPDVGPLLEAADVYLNGWPLGGGTSVLEAAALGLPLLSFLPDAARQGLMTLDIPSLDGALVRCATPEAYAAAAARLAGDPAERERLGARAREQVLAAHAGAGWTAALQTVMDAAASASPAPAPCAARSGRVTDWEAILETVHAGAQMGYAPEAALRTEGADPAAWPDGRAARAEPPSRRAIAAPGLEAPTVAAIVDGFRALRRLRAVSECAVALPPDAVAEGMDLLETALAAGEDVDIDVMPLADLRRVLRSDDLCLAEAGSAAEAAARGYGAEVRIVG